jgi:hypothetical protein
MILVCSASEEEFAVSGSPIEECWQAYLDTLPPGAPQRQARYVAVAPERSGDASATL